jgi:hypothetical protein
MSRNRVVGGVVAMLFVMVGVIGVGVIGVRTQAYAESNTLQRPGIALEIRPVADAPDMMVAEVTMTDLGTGQVVASPRVRFKRGQTAAVKHGYQDANGRDYLIEITVGVTVDGKVGTYTATTRTGASSEGISQTQSVAFHLSE